MPKVLYFREYGNCDEVAMFNSARAAARPEWKVGEYYLPLWSFCSKEFYKRTGLKRKKGNPVRKIKVVEVG